MDNEKIIEDLNRRFAEPLKEFYNRRIIFWIDDDGEFADEISSMVLANAKVVCLTGGNTFLVKKMITADDTTSNFLIYRPFSVEDEDNWLLNVELYSEEFRTDLISNYISELNLPTSPTMRKCVKEYSKFFKAKDRRSKILAITEKKPTTSQSELLIYMMATICNTTDISKNGILRSVLSCGLNVDDNTIYSEFTSYGIDKVFLLMIQQNTGYHEEEFDLGRLATHILLTASTRTLNPEFLAGLDPFISTAHQSYCYDFISDWLHSNENRVLYEIARTVEDGTRLAKRFEKVSITDLADTECFPCINENILSGIMNDINNHLIEIDTITSMVEKRRTMVWSDTVSCYFDAVLQVANMQSFYKEFSASFHEVKAKEVWKSYIEKYYKMDTYYRLYHLAFTKSLKESTPELDDLLKQVTEVVEGLYTNWFLGKLGGNWSSASEDELAKKGFIYEIARQQDFYQNRVEKSDTRVFVIISDALRYEVAATLSEQLRRETQAKVELHNMQGIFPTITKFGMAALLPHNELTVKVRNDKLTVLIDGGLTESNYRDKILKSYNAESVAVKYNDIIAMKRSERCEIVKGKEVVYIYHDTIDESSHTSDTAVFPACEDAISEIKNLIRVIVNDFSGTKIMITADHGFLYTYSPLQENDKVDKSSFKNKDIEYGRRYAILERGTTPDYLMPIKFISDEFESYAPRESIRIKMNGGGLNFVHGGASLQEMVVPVIEYRPLRNTAKEYLRNKQKYDTQPVTLNLLSSSKKISNMIFSLSFYQKEAVSDNREPATYLLYFVDSNGTQISDTQKIIADKTSDNGQDRTFRCSFNLKSLKYCNTETYYLTIAEESGLQLPQREEFSIDIAFAVEEFNFFD